MLFWMPNNCCDSWSFACLFEDSIFPQHFPLFCWCLLQYHLARRSRYPQISPDLINGLPITHQSFQLWQNPTCLRLIKWILLKQCPPLEEWGCSRFLPEQSRAVAGLHRMCKAAGSVSMSMLCPVADCGRDEELPGAPGELSLDARGGQEWDSWSAALPSSDRLLISFFPPHLAKLCQMLPPLDFYPSRQG